MSFAVVYNRTIKQTAAPFFEEALRNGPAIERIRWNKLVETSKIKHWDNIQEVYECTEEKSDGSRAVNVFFQTVDGLPNFRAVPGLEFLIPAGAIGNQLVDFLNGKLK